MTSEQDSTRTSHGSIATEDVVVLVSLLGAVVLAIFPTGHLLGFWAVPDLGFALTAPAVFLAPLGVGLYFKYQVNYGR